jgi:hypothetical protein
MRGVTDASDELPSGLARYEQPLGRAEDTHRANIVRSPVADRRRNRHPTSMQLADLSRPAALDGPLELSL